LQISFLRSVSQDLASLFKKSNTYEENIAE
jgi:hypothetical protein